MKLKRFYAILVFLTAIISSISCKNKEVVEPQLSVSATEISSPAEGGTSEITLTCNDKWSIGNSASSWLKLSQTSGNSGSVTIQLNFTSTNSTGAVRSTVLDVTSSNGQSRRVTVSQATFIYPSYNTSPKASDATGMSSTAVQLADKIKLGWNLGNTFEAPGGETGWGSPVITESYIKFVKQCGFNAIRIPCAWNWYHVDNARTAHIDPNWISRVKEVVGYCVSNDMYVLLNIHWDGGWFVCTTAKKDSVNAMQKALWEQIATTMRDFDEHLMFASSNEPDTQSSATQMNILLSYHQTFINAVRSTGGKNTYRSLVIQGDSKLISVNAFPTDPTPNRMMYEEHNYTPFQFCALGDDASWGKMFYYWGAANHSTIEPDRNPNWDCEENAQTLYFQGIKANFIDKGIPVLMGEYGAYRRDGSAHIPKDLALHDKSIDDWITFTTKTAIANGVKPFWWDTGGILDRSNNTVKDQRSLNAIIAGGN
jgi:aryl-phospho-beta-D-glucosidase BglC (GH1 family)